MNSPRNQLLAGASFSLDENGGIRGGDLFDLIEHGFQSRTLAYDLLESARIAVLFGGPESYNSSHVRPPSALSQTPVLAGLAFQSGSNPIKQDFVVERF